MFGSPSRYGKPGARYRDVHVSARIEGASPHGLIMILFEELLTGLDTLRAAERSGESARHAVVQSRVVSILHGLEAGLDHQRGGEIAASLNRIYKEARRLVAVPSGPDRAAALDQARAMVGDIAGAWASIA